MSDLVDIAALPYNCRSRQRNEGKAYPKSGCEHCYMGGLYGCPFGGSRSDTAPPAFPQEGPTRIITIEPAAPKATVAQIVALMTAMPTDEQRHEVMSAFCHACGSTDTNCRCRDDS